MSTMVSRTVEAFDIQRALPYSKKLWMPALNNLLLSIYDSKRVSDDSWEQWFLVFAAHSNYLGSFKKPQRPGHTPDQLS